MEEVAGGEMGEKEAAGFERTTRRPSSEDDPLCLPCMISLREEDDDACGTSTSWTPSPSSDLMDDVDDKPLVRLVYQMELGGKYETELQFTRAITRSGGSEYRINESLVTLVEYHLKLLSIGILAAHSNLLGFQGDLESILSMKPKELTELVENIHGSKMLNERFDHLEKEEAKALEKATICFKEFMAVFSERKRPEAQREKEFMAVFLDQFVELSFLTRNSNQYYILQ